MLRISAKTGNMAARFRPARTPAIAVSTARFAPASQNTPTSLTRPSWSETSPLGCGRCCRARPCTHRVAALALRSVVEDSESLACAIATAPGHEPADPAKGIGSRLVVTSDQPHATLLAPSFRCEAGRAALLPGATHNTYCAFVPLVPRFTPLFLIAPTLLTREPLRCGNKGSHNMALCDAPLLHCHADCFPPSPGGTRLPSSRGNQRASSQASVAPTQPLALNGTAGSASPESPHPSPMLDPFRPQGIVAGK